MADGESKEKAASPLFRTEALAEPEFGQAFAFAVPRWRSIGLMGAAALLLIVFFGFFAEFDRVAHARGAVVPVSGIARIVAPRPGIVSEIHVRQGQRVAKGASILKIASPDRLPGGESAGGETLESLREQQRVTSASLAAERQRRGAERSRLQEQAAELAAAAQSYAHRIALQEERIARNEKRLGELVPLRSKGFVSETVVLAIEEAILTQRQELAALHQGLTEARHELQRTRLRIGELEAGGREADLRSRARLLELDRDAAGAQVQAEVLLATPIEGVVSAFPVVEGMSVERGQQVAAIVRPGDRLLVELAVPSRAAGSLEAGQRVTLRFDAFPYQRFGVGHGEIEEIASSASIPAAGGEPAYLVRVRLLDADRFDLRPDMGLTASIMVEERSLLAWLFAPLRERWRERARPR